MKKILIGLLVVLSLNVSGQKLSIDKVSSRYYDIIELRYITNKEVILELCDYSGEVLYSEEIVNDYRKQFVFDIPLWVRSLGVYVVV